MGKLLNLGIIVEIDKKIVEMNKNVFRCLTQCGSMPQNNAHLKEVCMKIGFMILAMTTFVSAAQAFEIPASGATAAEAAIAGAIQSYAKQTNSRSEETGCRGSVTKLQAVNSQEGTAIVVLSGCNHMRNGEALLMKVFVKLNLSVPGGVYFAEKVVPYSAPSQALTAPR